MLLASITQNDKRNFVGTVYVYGNLSGDKVAGMVPTDLIYFKVFVPRKIDLLSFSLCFARLCSRFHSALALTVLSPSLCSALLHSTLAFTLLCCTQKKLEGWLLPTWLFEEPGYKMQHSKTKCSSRVTRAYK
jgi:hypothetical protein